MEARMKRAGRIAISVTKMLAGALHGIAAVGPAWFAHGYIALFGAIARCAPPPVGARIRNSLLYAGVCWPQVKFGRRQVLVGDHTTFVLFPHIGEFDDEAIFQKRLTYEQGAFRWLERFAGNQYDCVIEIGANVGVYSVFFDKLSRASGARLKQIVVFEPSHEAFLRLTANLAANDARNVTPLPLAVGDDTGFRSFFEPKGHLTNGSFIREFAAEHSDTVSAVPVLMVSARELEFFFEADARILVKIDAEGYEPRILAALGAIIQARRPDILVEVLPCTQDAIDTCPWLAGYRRFRLTNNGAEPFASIEACVEWRDWFLTASPLPGSA